MPAGGSMWGLSKSGWRVPIALAAAALLAVLTTTTHSQTVTGKAQHMTIASSYPVTFASPRRDSALTTATAATGTVTWSRNMQLNASPDWPPAILLWGEREVLVTYTTLIAVDRDGTALWRRPIQGGTPAAVGGGTLYAKGKHHCLEALDLNDRMVLDEAPFPGAMGDEVRVSLFWPEADSFLAALFQPGEDGTADGDPVDRRLRLDGMIVLKNRYPTTYGDWQKSFPGRSRLPPLLQPDSGILTLFTHEAIRVDMAGEQELSRFAIPLEQVTEWSVDTEGVYVVTGRSGGHNTLVALSATGAELWRWVDSETADPWAGRQPPIRGAHGRVYALTEGRVLAIENGRLLWQFDARSDDLRHGAKLEEGSFEIKDGVLIAKGRLRHGSVLADGSLLVTRGRKLHHLNAQGAKIFTVEAASDILSPPVVDAAGHIYVATASALLRID